MAYQIKVAGIDPSLNNFGMVKGILTPEGFSLTELKLSEAPPVKDSKTVRNNSKDLERARIQYKALTEFLDSVDAVFVELPVGSQSARSMASYGLCLGIIASVGKPLIQVTPTEVKLAACQSKTASKQDMIEWVVNLFPDADWLKGRGKTTLLNKNEHLADAVATIYAGRATDQFKFLTSFFKDQ